MHRERDRLGPVSYTHLDVYKRQVYDKIAQRRTGFNFIAGSGVVMEELRNHSLAFDADAIAAIRRRQ